MILIYKIYTVFCVIIPNTRIAVKLIFYIDNSITSKLFQHSRFIRSALYTENVVFKIRSKSVFCDLMIYSQYAF